MSTACRLVCVCPPCGAAMFAAKPPCASWLRRLLRNPAQRAADCSAVAAQGARHLGWCCAVRAALVANFLALMGVPSPPDG